VLYATNIREAQSFLTFRLNKFFSDCRYVPVRSMLATKFDYAVQLRTSSEPAPNRFGVISEPASVLEFGTNQLQTSSEQAPNKLA